MSSVRFVTEEMAGTGGLLLYKHTRMGKIGLSVICFRQRRLSKKFSLTILLFVNHIYRISYIYYVLHYQNICIYILYNLYINTHNNVTFSYKRNYTDIGLPCNRSVKLPEEASKPSPVRTRIRPIKIMSIKKCIVRNIYNSLSPLKLRKGEKGEHASESRQKFNG